MNFSDCYIAKVKSFLGLRSIDPPVVFNVFLEKNLKHLSTLIEKNKIIVIDENGDEVDSLLWKQEVLNYYENNYIEKLSFYEDDSNYEESTEDDEIYLEKKQGENVESERQIQAGAEEKIKITENNEAEIISVDDSDSFIERDTQEDGRHLEHNQDELEEPEQISKTEVEKKVELTYESHDEINNAEGNDSFIENDIQEDELHLEHDHEALEQTEQISRTEVEEKVEIVHENENEIARTEGDDSFIENDTQEDELHLELDHEEIEQAEQISRSEVEEKVEIAYENENEIAKTEGDDSFIESDTKEDEIDIELSQEEIKADLLSKTAIKEEAEIEHENNTEISNNDEFHLKRNQGKLDLSELLSKMDFGKIAEIADSTDSEKIILDDEFELNQIQGEFEELDRLNKIDFEEKAKIAHKNRLIESLNECEGEYRDIVQRGIESTDKKIEKLQDERKILLIRINQRAEEYSRRNTK